MKLFYFEQMEDYINSKYSNPLLIKILTTSEESIIRDNTIKTMTTMSCNILKKNIVI